MHWQRLLWLSNRLPYAPSPLGEFPPPPPIVHIPLGTKGRRVGGARKMSVAPLESQNATLLKRPPPPIIKRSGALEARHRGITRGGGDIVQTLAASFRLFEGAENGSPLRRAAGWLCRDGPLPRCKAPGQRQLWASGVRGVVLLCSLACSRGGGRWRVVGSGFVVTLSLLLRGPRS